MDTFTDEISDIVVPQTIESMTAAAEGAQSNVGPTQRELARAALAAGPGSDAWFAAEAALCESSH